MLSVDLNVAAIPCIKAKTELQVLPHRCLCESDVCAILELLNALVIMVDGISRRTLCGL